MQTYERLRGEFDLTAFAPHATRFDLSGIRLHKESLFCPIEADAPLWRKARKFQLFRDHATGRTHSFCGLSERLEGFDLYHIKDQAFCFSFEAVLAKRRFGGKLVVTQMENIPHLNEGHFVTRHVKNAVREEADLFLAASEGAVRTLREEGIPEGRIRRIANAVDVGHFRPGPPEKALRGSLGIPAGAFTVLYVGRLAKSKGVFTLLEAARAVSGDPGFHWLLVGKDEEGVGKWIARHGLGGSVHLTGPVDYREMPRYYRLADVFVLPSLPTRGWLEQFGYVLAEAMACGIPAAGSDCGAIPEVVGDPARVFPAGDAGALCGVLRRLRAVDRVPLGRKMRERACRLFSSERLVARLGSIYRELLGTS
jgi:glycosyltransferase involved in cell wall biosynthesis